MNLFEFVITTMSMATSALAVAWRQRDGIGASKPVVLVIDDIPSMIRLLQLGLSMQGFEVAGYEVKDTLDALSSGNRAWLSSKSCCPASAATKSFEQLQKRYPSLPVMFLTTEHNEGDRALAFELGADDYMTKPFDPDELGRRVSALIREPPSQRRVIRLNDLQLDMTRQLARRGNRVISLPTNESALILTMALRPGEFIPVRELLAAVSSRKTRCRAGTCCRSSRA